MVTFIENWHGIGIEQLDNEKFHIQNSSYSQLEYNTLQEARNAIDCQGTAYGTFPELCPKNSTSTYIIDVAVLGLIYYFFKSK